ncbi:MAG: RsmD family RNA methyltransferase [Fidelibacterota bacterium]
MPRIISGEFGGRVIKTPGYELRPTSDKVKEYIFNVIRDWEGKTVADLFAGSGSLGLEAVSRGAISVDFVDSHPLSIRMITENMERLNLDHPEIRRFKMNARTFCSRYMEYYDRILADPPYKLRLDASFFLSVSKALKKGGLFVLEFSIRETDAILTDMNLVKEKVFGETGVRIYEK